MLFIILGRYVKKKNFRISLPSDRADSYWANETLDDDDDDHHIGHFIYPPSVSLRSLKGLMNEGLSYDPRHGHN